MPKNQKTRHKKSQPEQTLEEKDAIEVASFIIHQIACLWDDLVECKRKKPTEENQGVYDQTVNDAEVILDLWQAIQKKEREIPPPDALLESILHVRNELSVLNFVDQGNCTCCQE